MRSQDNEALTAAVTEASSIVPVFLWKGCPANPNLLVPVDTATGGTAKDVFVSHALRELNHTLSGRLEIGIVQPDGGTESTDIADELASICSKANADAIYYPLSHSKDMEDELSSKLAERGVVAKSFSNSYSLLDYSHDDNVEVPWKDIILEHPFRSPLIPFVDWLLREMKERPPGQPLPRPERLAEVLSAAADDRLANNCEELMSLPITADELIRCTGITPGGTSWGTSIANEWPATERDATNNLNVFLASIRTDKKDKDIVDVTTKNTHLASRLSPYLARGLLSARQVYAALHSHLNDSDATSFVRRLCWRDYTYAATALYPDIEERKPIRDAYYDDVGDDAPVLDEEAERRLDLWKKGATGFPLIDAGMRQLIVEGWMPQKVRLAVSSMLVEAMDVAWEAGMRHFEEFLVDFDPAINANMWQNSGGVGFDPYYLGLRYKKRPYWDFDGSYVRRWVPELAALPDYAEIPEAQRGTGLFRVDCLYEPWTAPDQVLQEAGIELGKTYAHRACDERTSRRKFFGRLRMKRKGWDPCLTDERGLDNIKLGRQGERIGVFTAKALLDKRQFRTTK